jgi:hypothetical protein
LKRLAVILKMNNRIDVILHLAIFED